VIIAPGLSLRRLGLSVTDLALGCPGCGSRVAPASNAYDWLTYGCPCGASFSASLREACEANSLTPPWLLG
jgi:hypothetical protein